MRGSLKRAVVLGSIVFLWAALAYAQKADPNAIIQELNNELEKEALLTQGDLKSIEKPLKNMVEKGASKDDLRKVLKDLSAKGVKGKDLKSTMDSMNALVNSGESPKDAGNIVSRAAHQAQAEGLKGTALAAKVHEAIGQRKTERDKVKEQKMTQKEEGRKLKEESKETDQAVKLDKGMGRSLGHIMGGKGKR